MKNFLFLLLAFLTITTTVYASFPVTEELTEQCSDVDNNNDFNTSKQNNSTDIDWGLFIVCFLLGPLGIHRFMMGDVTGGILMLITLGGCGIWALIDLINIAMGNMSR